MQCFVDGTTQFDSNIPPISDQPSALHVLEAIACFAPIGLHRRGVLT